MRPIQARTRQASSSSGNVTVQATDSWPGLTSIGSTRSVEEMTASVSRPSGSCLTAEWYQLPVVVRPTRRATRGFGKGESALLRLRAKVLCSDYGAGAGDTMESLRKQVDAVGNGDTPTVTVRYLRKQGDAVGNEALDTYANTAEPGRTGW